MERACWPDDGFRVGFRMLGWRWWTRNDSCLDLGTDRLLLIIKLAYKLETRFRGKNVGRWDEASGCPECNCWIPTISNCCFLTWLFSVLLPHLWFTYCHGDCLSIVKVISRDLGGILSLGSAVSEAKQLVRICIILWSSGWFVDYLCLSWWLIWCCDLDSFVAMVKFGFGFAYQRDLRGPLGLVSVVLVNLFAYRADFFWLPRQFHAFVAC